MGEQDGSGDVEPPLNEECALFRRLLPTFDPTMSGQFVLVKGEGIVGVFATEEEAIRQGFDRLGAVPFLVRQVPPGLRGSNSPPASDARSGPP